MYHSDEELVQDGTPQLDEWFMGGGDNILETEFENDLSYRDFMAEQFERFKVPLTQKAGEGLLAFAAGVITHVLGSTDPYVMFWETTDVVMTEDWCKFAYQLSDGSYDFEIDPETLETFEYRPGLDEKFFSEALVMPGLEALPYSLGEYVQDAIWCHGEVTPRELLSGEAADELEELCSFRDEHGVLCIDEKKTYAYFELSCWAAVLWALGPLGKRWRYHASPIHRACYDHGSCIIHDVSIYDPTSYIKLERDPRSCYVCGVSAWCVEITQDGDVTRNICEHCLNSAFGDPRNLTMCGTKQCHHVACPNHLAHTNAKDGYWMSVRGGGQLHGMGGGTPVKGLGGAGPKLLKP